MRVLGLDLSLTSTGYVLLEEDRVLWHGSVAPKTRDAERLSDFEIWLRERALAEFQPTHVALEGYSFGSISHHHAIGELGGVVKLALWRVAMPVFVIPPATWKKQLLGKGNLAKDQVRLEAWKRYGIEFASQDTLDAWAVAMCAHRQLLGLDKPEPKARQRKSVPPHIPALEAAHGDSATGLR